MLGLLAHALHWSIVLLGLAGAGYLLHPQLRLSALLHHRRAYRPPRSLTEHDARILQLRAAVASGRLGEVQHHVGVGGSSSRPAHDGPARWADLRAVVATSSVSAGVIHAAVFPHHLRERVVVGVFFALAAIAQLVWAFLATRSAGVRLLQVGVAGNAFLICLWAMSRTVGLPGGLADGHQGIGAWDLAALVWELSVVAGCLALLRRPPADRLSMLTTVGRSAWLWAALSTVALTIITLLVPHE